MVSVVHFMCESESGSNADRGYSKTVEGSFVAATAQVLTCAALLGMSGISWASAYVVSCTHFPCLLSSGE